jgi:hypothetical protein
MHKKDIITMLIIIIVGIMGNTAKNVNKKLHITRKQYIEDLFLTIGGIVIMGFLCLGLGLNNYICYAVGGVSGYIGKGLWDKLGNRVSKEIDEKPI